MRKFTKLTNVPVTDFCHDCLTWSFLSISFSSFRRTQFSNAKLSPNLFNSSALNPLKCRAHSETKNSLNNSFRTTREINCSNFHTGQGYRFWSSSLILSRKNFSIWLKRGERWISEAPQASNARTFFFSRNGQISFT